MAAASTTFGVGLHDVDNDDEVLPKSTSQDSSAQVRLMGWCCSYWIVWTCWKEDALPVPTTELNAVNYACGGASATTML